MSVVKKGVHRWVPDSQGSWPATLIFAVVSGLLGWGLSYLSWRWLEQRLALWLRSRSRAAATVSAELAGQR
jgi:peptidoglycan/LPS O-acetylase OafA/YrhL